MKNTFALYLSDLKEEYKNRYSTPFLTECTKEELIDTLLADNIEGGEWNGIIINNQRNNIIVSF